MAESYLTAEGYKKLKAELKELREVRRSKVAAKIKDARDMGDVLENGVYDSALEEQGMIEGRIQEIEEILANATILKNAPSTKDTVLVGSTVVVEMEEKQDIFTIVGSAEADPATSKISHESPVGQALLGAKVGDEIVVKTPIITAIYKVLEIK